ncbi:MAG: hypothetical protein ABSB66_16560 [Candidatus Acidiferrales bacterium]
MLEANSGAARMDWPPARGVTIYAFANNHYAGHGPGTVALFKQLYGIPDSERAPVPSQQSNLFAAQKEENAK